MEKLCWLVNEFGRVYERRKLRVSVFKSKVMVFELLYVNLGRMNVGLNNEPFKEVDFFKYLIGVTSDNGCRMQYN